MVYSTEDSSATKFVQMMMSFDLLTARSMSIEGVLIICSNCSTLWNKRAAMSIYCKTHLKIFSSRSKKAFRLNLGIYHWGIKVYQNCSNDDPRMAFDILRHKPLS